MPKLNTTRTGSSDKGTPRIVVIGGGFGGLEVVKGLRGLQAEVVLFDKFNHHCFQPLLYQVATSGLESASIIMPFRKRFSKQNNFFFRLGEVRSIKAADNCIETSIGSVKYDYLILAHGASSNFYGLQNVEQHALPLKNITDAIKLRNVIIRNFEQALLADDPDTMNSLMDFVIVGGGPTGVELAGALSELKTHVFPKDYKELEVNQMDIHLVEASERLLNGMSPQASEKALEYLKKMGVHVHLKVAVKSYDGQEVLLSTGEKLISRTLVWAAGVKGQPLEGLRPEAFSRNGRIKVDQFNRVDGHPNIFAIGDAALMENLDNDFPKGHPMMAQPAMQQGKLVAKNIRNLIKKKPLVPFHYVDRGSMATVGRNKAVADLNKVKLQGVFAWFIWMFIHLISLMGFKNKFFVLINWLWSYVSYDKSNRLIIARPKDGIQ